jgi:hypothetical protein
MKWVLGDFPAEAKRPERNADHPHPSKPEVKNAWSYTFTPPYILIALSLIKHRGIF